MQVIAAILYIVLLLATILLLARLVVDWVRMISRDMRPQGLVLVLVEGILTLTDPPVNALRRAIPPVRIGAVSLDLSLMLLLLVCSLVMSFLARFAA